MNLRAIFSSPYIITEESRSYASSSSGIVEINSITGEMTAKQLGEATITINMTFYGLTVSTSFTVNVIFGGEYYIGNKDTGKVVDTNDGVTASGQQIKQISFDAGDTQKWTVIHIGDGYYTIILSDSYYLGVQGDSATDGASVVLRTGEVTDGMKWKITATSSGAYKLISKSGESNNCVLAVSGNTYDASIKQQQYTDNSDYIDEWELYKIGSDVALIGIQDTGHDHISCYSAVMSSITGLGQHRGFDVVNTDNMSLSTCRAMLENCEIFVSRSHGDYDTDETWILLGPSNNAGARLSASQLYDYDTYTPVVDLSGAEVVAFVGCSTAHEDRITIIQAAVDAGARYAIGFTQNIDCIGANEWTKVFFEYYFNGYSVTNAKDRANELCREYQGISSCKVVARTSS